MAVTYCAHRFLLERQSRTVADGIEFRVDRRQGYQEEMSPKHGEGKRIAIVFSSSALINSLRATKSVACQK
jgi:hypothetical protein